MFKPDSQRARLITAARTNAQLALYFVSGRRAKLQHAGQELNQLGRAGVSSVYIGPTELGILRKLRFTFAAIDVFSPAFRSVA